MWETFITCNFSEFFLSQLFEKVAVSFQFKNLYY